MNGRVRAFDWLRGLAVPFMIQTHALSLLLPPLVDSKAGLTLRWIDGLVAPSFILASGFALGLLQVRAAASGTQGTRRLRTLRRIFEVLGVATLVNWMWFPLFREPRWLFRVDILHCIGLSLLLVFALVTLLARRPRVLVAVTLALAGLVFFLAPFGAAVTGPWAMLANKTTGAVFPLLPWSGYVLLGSALGAMAANTDAVGLAKRVAALGAFAFVVYLLTPILEHAYPPHPFGTFNPAEHARRLTVISVVLLGLLHVEHRLPRWGDTAAFKFLEVFGTSSMAAYFFHEALLFFQVFGFSFEKVWGKSQGWLGFAALTLLLIALTWVLSWITDKVYRWMDRRPRPAAPASVEQVRIAGA